MSERRESRIVVEETLPHPPARVWRALTTGSLVARWMGMEPLGFAPVAGTRFTFQTDPAGAWDGRIDCEVLTAEPERRLRYSWRGGDPANRGYGSLLDTVVTITLRSVEGDTLLRVEHAGFELPRNAVAYDNMSDGWTRCAVRLRQIANDA